MTVGAATAATLVIAVPVPAAAAPTPSITISDVTVTEGTGAAVNATFTIQASPPPRTCCPLQVSWATATGSATSADFTPSSGTVSLTKTTSTRTVSVPVTGDAMDEPSETFVVNLSNLVGSPGQIGDAQGVGTITDNDPLPALSIANASIAEGNAGTSTLTFTVSLSAASGNAVTFDWATSAGTATAGIDYATGSGSRTIAAGATSTTVAVTVNGDTTDENNETLTVTLSNPGNATVADGSGAGTITDDDAPPTISVNDVSLAEGNAGTTTATFTVSLSAVSGRTVSFDWATSPGTATAGTDYVTGGASATIAAGAVSTTVAVTVNGDVVDEANETFTVTLSNPGNVTMGDGTGVGTITDDDPLPALSIADASIAEGNAGTSTLTFTVSLSAASGRTVTAGWVTSDDEATQPSDYTSASGTVTFVAGDTTETVGVTVNGDLVAELDEDLLVVLSAPTDATLADATGVGTIVDDELLPVIDIDEPSIAEGAGGPAAVTFSVTLSHPSAMPVTVDWATVAGTATPGTDYFDTSGTVSFAPLDVSETVEITANGDLAYEIDETFAVDLSNASGAPIGDTQGVATLVNDDAAPAIDLSDASIVEGNTGTRLLTFTATLTGESDLDASVSFATSNGTATAGGDYTATSGTLTVPAGQSSATVIVSVSGDAAFEPDETLTVSLSDPTDVTIGDGTGTGTIENDDKAKTTITLRVLRKPTKVIAKGVLEPTQTGHRVTATLFRKINDRFVKVAAKTVAVRFIKDRDGDGKKDGSYLASFARPKAAGTYKVRVAFRATGSYKGCSRSRTFTLRAL